MTTTPLSYEEKIANNGATHRVKVTHEDLTEASTGTAQVLTLFSAAANDIVDVIKAKLVTAFSDASDSAFDTTAVTAGYGGAATAQLASMECNVNGTEITQKAGTGTAFNPTSADTLDLTVNSKTGKSLSNIDAGELHVYLRIQTAL